MMPRIERILIKLAQQHAPHLLSAKLLNLPDVISRCQELARGLTSNGILVLVGDFSALPLDEQNRTVQEWVRLHGQMYNLLSLKLFPTYSRIAAFYADTHTLPVPVVVFDGDATPVIQTITGYIVPYLALRQSQHPHSELEIRGLMVTVLEELEAQDVPRTVYQQMLESGVALVIALIGLPMRHLALTGFSKPILNTPPAASSNPNPPPPPGKLPEQDHKLTYQLDMLPHEALPNTATEDMFKVELPLPKRGAGGLRPPVPPLKNR